MSEKEIEEIITKCTQNDIEFIRFEQCDTCGVSRSKTVPLKQFKSFASEGFKFFMGIFAFDPQAGLAMGSGVMESTGFADSTCYPQPGTFKILPWVENTARVLIEPTYNSVPVKASPRVVAKHQLERLNKLGFELYSGHEYEFYVVQDLEEKKPLWKGKNIFSTIQNQVQRKLVYDIMRNAAGVGIDVLTGECEYGPGQLELPYAPAWGIESADNAFTFKHLVKEICQDRGIVASFMSKPWTDESGNSCHFNHSLWRSGDCKENAMFDSTKTDELSDVGKHWLAGLLEHAPAISALMAPTVNCRKRYKTYTFAPIYANWGNDNRTCAMRVKIGGAGRTYIENRLGAGGSNPYLVLAATVAAGLDGIERELPLQKATRNGYDEKECAEHAKIPITLKDSIEALTKDQIICDALGAEFIQCWTALANHLIDEAKKSAGDTFDTPDWNNTVSDHERDLYFQFL